MESEFVYEPMVCLECGATITPTTQNPGTATSPTASIYVCRCGFSYSNSRDPTARTAFAPTAEANVPEGYRANLNGTLAAAANIGNRKPKAVKFTYSTSEDAITCTIFRWLQDEGALAVVADAAGVPLPKGEPELLFWGAAVGGAPTELSQQLQRICLSVDGSADRLTEPDVVIAWPSDVFFVEVKCGAPNERKPGYAHFDRYTRDEAAADLFAVTPSEVAASGWYELTRNWRIGAELAAQRSASFTLVNLGPVARQPEAAKFATTVAQTDNRRFAFMQWKQLLELARRNGEMSSAIEEFVRKRRLEGRWG